MTVELMNHHFGIGVGAELVPQFPLLLTQPLEVLDNTVMNNGMGIPAQMRVGITIAGGAMSRPTGMRNADAAGGGVGVQRRAKLVYLADRAYPPARVLSVDHREAGGVVPSILPALQPFKQNRRDVTLGGGSNDPTHG